MIEFILVIITQIGYQVFRTLDVIYVSRGNKLKSILSVIAVQVCWLLSTLFSVKGIAFDNNWYILVVFVLSGVVGRIIANKMINSKNLE